MTPESTSAVAERSTPSRAATVVAWAVALVAALGAAWLAPADWSAGPGALAVELRGTTVVDEVVEVGNDDAESLDATTGSTTVTVDLPSGVPLDAPIEVRIAVTEAGQPVRPSADDVRVDLTLPDGRVELLPIVRWDDATASLVGSRQPTSGAVVVLALLALVVVLWVSEALPLFVTSLAIPIVLVASGVVSAGDATAPFANPIIVLFFAGFLMAEAMHRTRLDHWVAVAVTARAGTSAVGLFATVVALAAFLSMWMSNTAAAAVLIPVAIAISEPLDHRGLQRTLVLGIAYAATIGGVGSAIGTPANQLAIEFLDGFGFGLPMTILFLPLMGLYLWWRGDIHLDPGLLSEARRVARREREQLGRPDRDQLVVLAVFGAVMLGWLTETFHGVHAGLVALAGAVALFVLGRLLPEDLGRISWPALLTFGGGLTLGLALVQTGTSDHLATRLTGLAGLPSAVAVLAVALIALGLTTVASNTASAAILIPLALPLARVLGVDPTMLVVVVAVATSIDFALVIGTPPTMIAHSTGLLTARQIFRRGILLDLVGLLVLVFVVTRIWEVTGMT